AKRLFREVCNPAAQFCPGRVKPKFLQKPHERSMAATNFEHATGRPGDLEHTLEPEQTALGEGGSCPLTEAGKAAGCAVFGPVTAPVEILGIVRHFEVPSRGQDLEHGGAALVADPIVTADLLAKISAAPARVDEWVRHVISAPAPRRSRWRDR